MVVTWNLDQDLPWSDESPYVKVPEAAKKFVKVGKFVHNFYIREEVAKLWQALKALPRDFIINGTPGVGKTMTTLLWALWEATKHKKKILWYNNLVRTAYDIHDNQIRYYEFVSIEELMTHIDAIKYSILIIDSATVDAARPVFCRSLNLCIILVSSCLSKRSDKVLKYICPKVHTMLSWTLQDYHNACQDDQTFQ